MSSPRATGLLLCLLASVSAHGVLLLNAWAPALNWAPSHGREARPVRALRMTVPAQPPAFGRAAPVVAAEHARGLLTAPGLLTPSLPVLVSPLPSRLDPDLPLLERIPPSMSVEGGYSVYIPRPLLTVPPVLQKAVALVWPEDGFWTGHFTDVLTLYIDEQGIVQRVDMEGQGLPEGLRELARQAFLGASFAPGQLNGQQVKSKIRVEVSFAADPSAKVKGGLR